MMVKVVKMSRRVPPLQQDNSAHASSLSYQNNYAELNTLRWRIAYKLWTLFNILDKTTSCLSVWLVEYDTTTVAGGGGVSGVMKKWLTGVGGSGRRRDDWWESLSVCRSVCPLAPPPPGSPSLSLYRISSPLLFLYHLSPSSPLRHLFLCPSQPSLSLSRSPSLPSK